MSALDPLIEALNVARRGADAAPVTRLGTVTGGTNASITVRFDGETTASGRLYALTFGPVSSGDRVVMLRVGATWVAMSRLVDSEAKWPNSGPVAPTLLNGWIQYNGFETRYQRLNGLCVIEGLLYGGNGDAFVLPVGYRPLTNRLFPTVDAGGTPRLLYVYATGAVSVAGAHPTWCAFNCSFVTYPQ